MRKELTHFVAALATIFAASASLATETSLCREGDFSCKDFERLANAGQFDKIIKEIDSAKQYSEGARHYISKAYLEAAAAENNTPEQEEAFLRKAIEFGSAQGYMGLYFIYLQKDEAQALEFLRQYVATKPRDPVPYAILGESELNKKNYRLADTYLRESKKAARAESPRVAWMLFQVNYLLGNYQYASEMFGNALENGRFDKELKALSTDVRFQGIEKRPEFKKHQPNIIATMPRS